MKTHLDIEQWNQYIHSNFQDCLTCEECCLFFDSSKGYMQHYGKVHETDWEATYRAQIYPWLALQPNVQYIIHPNMNVSLENAWVVGFRTEIAF